MSWHNFKSWDNIRDWAKEKNFKNLVARMELNNRCWNSSGEFGRSQVEICDTLRNTASEETALTLAEMMDKSFATNYGLWGEDE